MHRYLASLSTSVLLGAAALAQCPQGQTANLVAWDAFDGFATLYFADDEGITTPPIALASPFPMAGAAGTLDTLWVGSNGEVYLTDSAAALTVPAGAAEYGVTSVAEMRGAAGSSARVVFCGDDQQGSIAPGAVWDVTIDTSIANEVRITWIDMRRYADTTDRYSFTGRLFLSGHPNAGTAEASFGTLPADTRYVGISIGNNVAPTAVSSDLSAGPNSGTDGFLYEAFTAASWDLNGKTVTLAPNGTGGYTAAVTPYAVPTCAFVSSYGTGCYSIPVDNSLYEVFPSSAAAKAALDGNSLTFLHTNTGYVAVWNGASGPAFVPPGGGATTLVMGAALFPEDDGSATFTTSSPIPVAGSATSTWNASVNGILTAAANANNPEDYDPLASSLTDETLAPATAFYTWRDFLLDDSVANGTITVEETGGFLYVSWNAVEAYPFATANPSTWQYQVNMATGDVTIVWQSFDASTSTDDTIVGVTLAGSGATPGAVTLATGLPAAVTQYDPLTLTATGRPVITAGGTGPSQVVTLTATNVPDAAPPLGVSLGVVFFSLGSIPGGIDLGPAGVDIGMPGCSIYLASLDVALGFPTTQVGRQVVFNAAIPQPLTAGQDFFVQALALIPPNSLPGGLNNFGAVMSNGVQLHFENQ